MEQEIENSEEVSVVVSENGELSERVLRQRYAYDAEETWDELSKRVADHVAKAELVPEAEQHWSSEFYEIIANRDFIPGGRTLRNANRPQAQLLNCFALGVEDNIEDIGELAKNVLIVSSGGGGVGINFSKLRPNNTPLFSKGGVASGPVSYMRMIDAIGQTVETGGQRRAALIYLLNVDHPDIMEFLDAKQQEGVINNANISVCITDDFIEAVEADDDWELEFGGRTYSTVKAKEIWDKLVHANWAYGDPGIINLSNIEKYNNISYYQEIYTVNPCSEITLEVNGCCCLGSINLDNMLKPAAILDEDAPKWSEVDWDKLERTVRASVRFLDNVLSINDYPLDEIAETAHNNRRIGLGVMGLHYMLLEMGIEYGSNERCLRFLDELFRFIKEVAYSTSVDLAIEKNPFPKFNRRKFLKGSFIQSLPTWLRDKIRQHGIRNCSVLTIPPTGTTAQIPNVSTGLEPVFSPAYTRLARLGNGKEGEEKLFYVLDRKFEELEAAGLPTDHFRTSRDLSAEDHLTVQATIQQHVDNSLSKTINIPEDYSEEELSKIMLEWAGEVKGFTVYRTNSRFKEILRPIGVEEAKQHVHRSLVAMDDENCPDGHCDI